MTDTLSAALSYAERGWRVIPVKPRSKRAAIDEWPERATTSAEQIRAWWAQWPQANVGIVAGPETGLLVLDIDGDPRTLLNGHEQPPTVAQRTGGGGLQYLYRWPKGLNGASTRAGILPSIDTRGAGGYFVAPPSLHPSGNVYQWAAGLSPEDLNPSDPPQWLLEALHKARPKATGTTTGDKIPEGQRNARLTSLAGMLRNTGMTAAAIAAALAQTNRERCDPPLPDDEVRGIAASVERYEASASVLDPEPSADSRQIDVGDFFAHMPDHRYIFAPTRDLWPAASVDSRLPSMPGAGDNKIRASHWLDMHAPVEQMLWAPGEPMLIRGRLIDTGGWLARPGVTAFNLYRAPTLKHGDPAQAGTWVAHIRGIYGDDTDHIIRWLAHRVQHPGVKINHGLVLGGPQGIGKDTLLEPVKHAVGAWNFHEVAPGALLGRFNSFVKSVILRISEARDLGDMDRFTFYEHIKTYTAAPPDVLRCDEKNIREHAVMNVCGVVITTNHKTDGIYLPADDRRHFVAWSDVTRDEFDDEYWRNLWGWYERGGIADVAAYLATLDLSDFNPKSPPRKTDAFWHIVDAARAPEETELADLIDQLDNPQALTLALLIQRANLKYPEFAEWLADRKNSRKVPHRLESAGYERVRNPAAKDGQWVIDGRRQAVYALRGLTIRDRITAAERLTRYAL